MSTITAKPKDPRPAIRGYLFLDGFVRLTLWYSSIALAAASFTALGGWPEGVQFVNAELPAAWRWGQALSQLVLLYNIIYILEILALRLLLPRAKEGEYSLKPGQRIDRALLWSALSATLLRARYESPFPGFLVFHLTNLPPLCWLYTGIMGPRSRSCFPLDPPIPDPDLTTIGRNVTIGNMTSVICHTQYRDSVSLRKTVIEDDVMVGAHALLYGGCHVKRGAVIYGGAVVPPNTVIGENEAWGGVPARKIRDLPPAEGTGDIAARGEPVTLTQ